MNALRLTALLATLAVTPAAFAQQAPIGREAGPARQLENKVSRPGQRAKIFPLGSSWLATSLNGKTFTGDRPSFSLDDQLRARGFGGCNTYAATAYPLREQNLAVGPLAITKKSCDKGLMESEHAFFVALRSSGQWDIQGATLVIQTQSGELRFERML
ncbi:META domain-containing protein [Microvirga flavescens]|uniref:META domain-containing protein n=1 Tax=Microvirga flavescens TaxID=2249811 RepID=UPI001FE00047|nr:META domain-containing protein [Microvirga flavescens]